MKRMKRPLFPIAMAIVLLSGASVAAQMQHGQTPQPGSPPPREQPMMGGMRGQGGMGMMCPMMGGQGDMSGMPMMGGMGSSQDPKMMGRMLQMRGEMLKAMGDIMLKHGKEMAEGQKP
jgi:hypothetical protein